ncbi:MAG TPA: chemotaxis protein CheD [Desulfovibrio sp.]|nr:chemotaxis protein CheD [Desulfovibrio sp.]
MDVRALLAQGLRQEHLKIGECIFTTKDLLIVTVLGSCVSVTFHHAGGAAAMFHAMLPDSGQASGPVRHPCNFADLAVEAILERFRAKGLGLREIQTRLFGGGNTFCAEERDHIAEMLDVGRKNVAAARAALKRHGLTPLSEDVLGARGRKVLFHTGSGTTWVRGVDAAPDDDFICQD